MPAKILRPDPPRLERQYAVLLPDDALLVDASLGQWDGRFTCVYCWVGECERCHNADFCVCAARDHAG